MAEKIEIANKTGIPELDAIIKATSQKQGQDLSGCDYGDFEPFSTGSLVFDIALHIGGLPIGQVIEVYGEEGSLKTSFCLAALAQKQRARREAGITGKRDLIIDLEHSMQRSFIEGFGVNMDEVIWQRVDTVEAALQMCIDYPKSGAIDVVIFDSIDAGQNAKQQSRQVGENDVGGISKDMNFAIRQISKIGPKYGTTFLFINQIKMNPGQMFGSPETTPGGRAMQYYATVRIKMMKRGKCSEIPGATLMRAKIRKSKMGPDYEQEINAAFLYGQGYNEVYDLNLIATSCGILKHSAGRSKVQWSSNAEPEYLCEEKGKQAALDAIAADSNLRLRLRHACYRAAEIPGAWTDEEVLEYLKNNKGETT